MMSSILETHEIVQEQVTLPLAGEAVAPNDC